MMDTPVFTNYCFEGFYTYLISSAADADKVVSQIPFFGAFLGAMGSDPGVRVEVLETIDDMRNLKDF